MNARTTGLAAAIAAMLSIAAPGGARAVSLSSGTGQALLYPYYTANGGNQTLVTAVNTTGRVKAIKVRFLEGRNSRPVLSFNLYLAPFDAWTAAVIGGADGTAELITNDASCTVPRLEPIQAVPFRNDRYTGEFQDFPNDLAGELGSLARTREGHIELIEMGELQSGTEPAQLAEEASFEPRALQPSDCAQLVTAWLPGGVWDEQPSRDIDLPSGGLIGRAAVVDVAEGIMFTYPATALADLYTDAAAPGSLHESPSGFERDIADAANGAGVARAVVAVNGAFAVEEYPATGDSPDAVSLVLLRGELQNDFVAEAALGASTEWVVTFPTRRFYTDVPGGTVVAQPFTDPFRDDGRASERVAPSAANRDGLDSFAGCEIATLPPPGCNPAPPTLDYSVNVIDFSATGPGDETAILGASGAIDARTFVRVFPEAFPNGTMRIDLAPQGAAHFMVGPTTGLVYEGMPAIGFAVTRIVNTAARPGLIANYAGAQPHRGELFAPVAIEVD